MLVFGACRLNGPRGFIPSHLHISGDGAETYTVAVIIDVIGPVSPRCLTCSGTRFSMAGLYPAEKVHATSRRQEQRQKRESDRQRALKLDSSLHAM